MKDMIMLFAMLQNRKPPSMTGRIVAVAIGLLFHLILLIVGVRIENTLLMFYGGVGVVIGAIILAIVIFINYRRNSPPKW